MDSHQRTVFVDFLPSESELVVGNIPSKNAALMVFLAIPYKMEAVRSPLGYRKECQVRVDRFAGHAL